MQDRSANFLSLFASSSTLICCALPSLFVVIGAGASFANLITVFPFLIVLSSFAPHLSEELWSKLGNKESISLSKYPKYNDKFLDEDEFEYPIMINGKLRTKIKFSLEANGDEVKKQVVQNDIVLKWIKNENVKKIIFVPKKIINIVI